MSKPAKLPRWANVGGAITEPPELKKNVGWLVGEKPPAQYENWLDELLYEWCAYLDAFETFGHTWIGLGNIFQPATGNIDAVTGIGHGSGAGVNATGGATNGIGVNSIGLGSGSGVYAYGGVTNAPGVVGRGSLLGGNGPGVVGQGAGTGAGVVGYGVALGNANGVEGNGTGNGAGVLGQASGTSAAVVGTGTATTKGVQGTSVGGVGVNGISINAIGVHGTGAFGVVGDGTGDGPGVTGNGHGAGAGIVGTGGATDGHGAYLQATANGAGVIAFAGAGATSIAVAAIPGDKDHYSFAGGGFNHMAPQLIPAAAVDGDLWMNNAASAKTLARYYGGKWRHFQSSARQELVWAAGVQASIDPTAGDFVAVVVNGAITAWGISPGFRGQFLAIEFAATGAFTLLGKGGSAGSAGVLIAGGVYLLTNGGADTLTLAYDGTSWVEVARANALS